MKASSTRDSSANLRTVFSALVSNRTSTRSQKTGGCHYLILLLPGKSYVWKASSSPATNHLRSSVPDPPLHTSVPSISNANVTGPSSRPSNQATQTVTRGWPASARRNPAFSSQDTYVKIGLPEYRALRAKGVPKAIPTMCVLTIKKDEMLNPIRAKSHIVVLGNHEDRVWTKSEKYAPVLRPDSLRLMISLTVERRRTLKQGNCKNAFCQGIFPDDEITIVKPPIGDPDAAKDEYWLLRKTLYGLRRLFGG